MQVFFRLGYLEFQNWAQLRPVTYMQSLSSPQSLTSLVSSTSVDECHSRNRVMTFNSRATCSSCSPLIHAYRR